MSQLKKIQIVQFAKFQAFLCGLVGLLCGIFYSIGGLIIDALVSLGLLAPVAMSTAGLGMGTILAFGALIGMPILFALAGFLLGIVESILYNLYARWFGGVRITFEERV